MSRFLMKMLAVMLAVATVGAQLVCACPTAVAAPQAAEEIAAGCVGEGDCCIKEDAKTPPPAKDEEPCDQCNLKHPALQAVPDTQSTAPSHQPALDTVFLPLINVLPVDITATQSRYWEGVRPPLLHDLVSCHTLLLN
jgi:hypothetical protein